MNMTPAASAWWPICTGRADHDIVDKGLTVLERLAHRGASGAEASTGDGAGILVQIPHRFFAEAADAAGVRLPERGRSTAGLTFLPADPDDAVKAKAVIDVLAAEEGLRTLSWRDIPIDPTGVGAIALGAMPGIVQLFVAPIDSTADTMTIERLAFVLRKRAEHAVEGVYFPSLSARTIVYKGMLTSEQLRLFFPDFARTDVESGPRPRAFAIFDQHLPELAAGSSVPIPRPQRGDQHGCWVTATGCGLERRCSRPRSSKVT